MCRRLEGGTDAAIARVSWWRGCPVKQFQATVREPGLARTPRHRYDHGRDFEGRPR